MQNKRLKTMSLLLAATFILGACGAGGEEASQGSSAEADKSSQSSEAQSSEAQSSEPVEEEVTLKILTQDSTQSTFAKVGDAPVWDYISEKLGINLEFESYSGEDLGTKKTLIFSDPENMPDIFWQATLTEEEVLSYGQQGLLLELDDLIEQYGENIKKCWASDPAYAGYAASVDGHYYTLPSYNVMGCPSTMMINDRWMKNVGVDKYPTNLDEFKELLIKFKEMDANGNGDPDDEIPMQGNQSSLVAILTNAVGMMGSWPYVGVLYASDAGSTETYPMFMEERYRYIVEYMRDLYAEGLVDNDMFTVTGDETSARRQSDIYGVLPQQTWPETVDKYDPNEWTAIPLMGSKYMETVEIGVAGPAFQVAMASVNANTEHPEAVIKFLDYMFSPDGSALFGVMNPAQYDLAAAGVSQDVIDILTEAWDGQVDTGVVGANLYGTYGCRWMSQFAAYKYPTTEYANNIQKTIDENLRVPYVNTGKMNTAYTYTLKFNAEESEVIAQYKTDIDTYVKDKLGQWISGNEPLTDDTWNQYITTLQNMHVEDLTDAYQASVNRFYGVE